eukprot:scaffold3618_cov129-Cylindrotheca_fusiformis.AAC.31
MGDSKSRMLESGMTSQQRRQELCESPRTAYCSQALGIHGIWSLLRPRPRKVRAANRWSGIKNIPFTKQNGLTTECEVATTC